MTFILAIVFFFGIFSLYDFFSTCIEHTVTKLGTSTLFLSGFIGMLTVHTDFAFALLFSGAFGLIVGEYLFYSIQE